MSRMRKTRSIWRRCWERIELLLSKWGKTALAAAKAELKALESIRDEAAMKNLMAAMAEKGVSVEDVIGLIKGAEGEA